MALVMEGRVQEGIRELDPLQTYSEVSCLEKYTMDNTLLDDCKLLNKFIILSSN